MDTLKKKSLLFNLLPLKIKAKYSVCFSASKSHLLKFQLVKKYPRIYQTNATLIQSLVKNLAFSGYLTCGQALESGCVYPFPGSGRLGIAALETWGAITFDWLQMFVSEDADHCFQRCFMCALLHRGRSSDEAEGSIHI